MLVQISSGQGPGECEIAVEKLFNSLQSEYKDVKMIDSHRSRFSGGYTSILFSTDEDLSDLDGTVQWICKSPMRPHHKRKNWFVDVSVLPEAEEFSDHIDENKDVKVEYFHSGGNGGQNVNKVETGVRLTHIPTGIVVTSTSERSQLLNRKDALYKLYAELSLKKACAKAAQDKNAWSEHNKLVRGNPVRVYEGTGFKRKK